MSNPARSSAAGSDMRRGSTLSRLAAPARMLTPLGRGLLLMGLFAMALSVKFHWQEFTQLAAVAFILLALGLVWQLIPAAMVIQIQIESWGKTAVQKNNPHGPMGGKSGRGFA